MPTQIEYTSTRGQDQRRYSFTDALVSGTAERGGLLVPERFPEISLHTLTIMSAMPYWQRVATIMDRFHTNIDKEAIEQDAQAAYGSNFNHPDIVPVRPLARREYPHQHIQEQFYGPKAAFKCLALQLMSRLVVRAVAKDNENREAQGRQRLYYLILGATSGDTGASAEEAFTDKPECGIIVFFPQGNVSRLQELQMTTQEGDNVVAHPMRGNFDQVQKAVKEVFKDTAVNNQLEKRDVILSSANSINWGRILPQIAYHVSAYAELIGQGVIHPGEKIDIAVPTGNFGNILAAFYAKKMGLPVGKLICASNENNVLTEFLETGVYDKKSREWIKTPSPSMDILVASNVERLLHAITGDTKKVTQWMLQLDETGTFTVDDETREILKETFYAGWVSNEECLTNIAHVAYETGYIMDPHTSVAQVVAQEFLEEVGGTGNIVISSTAAWSKFAVAVRDALIGGRENLSNTIDPEDEFAAIHQVVQLFPEASVPECITGLQGKPELHTTVFDATKQGVEESINLFLANKKHWVGK